MTTLFIEPFGGLAGDMFLAALFDLEDPRFTLADLRELGQELVPGECSMALERVRRGAISGSLLTVETEESSQAPHRHLSDLTAIIEASPLGPAARTRATSVLRRIAQAEAKVHGTTVERVHFHEVGAVDTLIDVCGVVFGLEKLEVERVITTPPITGMGLLQCEHGEMPVPPPAVAEILRGRPIRIEGGQGERLTPTGAALLAELAESYGPPGEFDASRIGFGAGARDPKEGPPNLVRVQLGRQVAEGPRTSDVCELAVNVDDMTGEEIGHALEALRASGALDVWTTPVQMKKGRPGVVISALCRPDDVDALERTVFETTSTLGLRWFDTRRTECIRRNITVTLDGHDLRVKVRERPDYDGASPLGERDLSPEHDDVAAFAKATGLTLREAERRAIVAARDRLSERDENVSG